MKTIRWTSGWCGMQPSSISTARRCADVWRKKTGCIYFPLCAQRVHNWTLQWTWGGGESGPNDSLKIPHKYSTAIHSLRSNYSSGRFPRTYLYRRPSAASRWDAILDTHRRKNWTACSPNRRFSRCQSLRSREQNSMWTLAKVEGRAQLNRKEYIFDWQASFYFLIICDNLVHC